MPVLRIPTPLRTYTQGQSEVTVQGGTVAEAMDELTARFPSLRAHLFNGDNQLRPFVNLFLNDENIKELQGLETSLKESDRLMLIPSIAGGRV
ncbi:MAG: MoaD/ThiS family protein [Chloroflexota bacterium]|nr:MAG: MoaD/ThiS family protein [Chloroflexota bacterium]